MEKFHPSIRTRLESVGKGYETLAFKTLDYEKEAHQFFVDFTKHMKLCKDQKNRQLILEKEKKLSLAKLDERMDKLSGLADATRKYTPDFRTLTYATRPYVDGILAFREILIKEMQKLANNIHNKEQSEVIMANLETKFSPLYKDLEVCRNNLDNCLSHFEELKKLYSEIED